MAKFYFTYGNRNWYPFQNGWTEVIASDSSQAEHAFKLFHPCLDGSICVNCDGIFSEEGFAKQDMEVKGNLGHKCWERILVTMETGFPEDPVDGQIVETIHYKLDPVRGE